MYVVSVKDGALYGPFSEAVDAEQYALYALYDTLWAILPLTTPDDMPAESDSGYRTYDPECPYSSMSHTRHWCGYAGCSDG